MSEALLERLQVALDKLLEQNDCMVRECRQLRQEKAEWQDEKTLLLADVERALKRFDSLDLEGL